MIKDRNTRTRKQAVIDLIERELSQLYRVGYMIFAYYSEFFKRSVHVILEVSWDSVWWNAITVVIVPFMLSREEEV